AGERIGGSDFLFRNSNLRRSSFGGIRRRVNPKFGGLRLCSFLRGTFEQMFSRIWRPPSPTPSRPVPDLATKPAATHRNNLMMRTSLSVLPLADVLPCLSVDLP